MTAELSPADVEALVRRYYTTVDAGDDNATADLFAADGTYDRPGYDTMVGEDIRRFYLENRIIESGEHTLLDVIVSGNQAASRGKFNGKLKDGSDAHEGFADFFVFNADGTIAKRTSYFYRAAV